VGSPITISWIQVGLTVLALLIIPLFAWAYRLQRQVDRLQDKEAVQDKQIVALESRYDTTVKELRGELHDMNEKMTKMMLHVERISVMIGMNQEKS
jgi:hypothetical protein